MLLPFVALAWTQGAVAVALAVAAVAVYAAARSLLQAVPLEEISIGRGGIAFRRRLMRDAAVLEDVKSIAVEDHDGELHVALVHGDRTVPIARHGTSESSMERPEVEWLEGRLRRALERARRQP